MKNESQKDYRYVVPHAVIGLSTKGNARVQSNVARNAHIVLSVVRGLSDRWEILIEENRGYIKSLQNLRGPNFFH